jgi:microcystin-dependent protein
MNILSRVTQKIFGNSGPTGDFGQFSSGQSSPVYTKDPSTIQALAGFLTGWKAATYSTQIPALEDMNSLFFLAYRQLAYLFEAGIPEWDAGTTYSQYSFVQVSGVVYVSLQNTNLNQSPAGTPAYWQTYGTEPVGVIKDFAGALPSGYLACDGSAVSRTTYSALFAYLNASSLPWGSGDGVNTFNVPDLRGKGRFGYDVSQTEFNALGKTGGEKTHQLTTAEMPSHNHSYEGSFVYYNGGSRNTITASGQHDQGTVSNVIQNTGGDGAHNNLAPYGTVTVGIKY